MQLLFDWIIRVGVINLQVPKLIAKRWIPKLKNLKRFFIKSKYQILFTFATIKTYINIYNKTTEYLTEILCS